MEGKPIPERDHGLIDLTRYLKGVPRVKAKAQPILGVEPVCLNCGCQSIYEIEVELENVPSLKPGKQLGTYLGCPACPWASPMLAFVVQPVEPTGPVQ